MKAVFLKMLLVLGCPFLLVAGEGNWGSISLMQGGIDEPVVSLQIERKESIGEEGGRSVLFTFEAPKSLEYDGVGPTVFIQPRKLLLEYSGDGHLKRIETERRHLSDQWRTEYSVFALLLALGALDLDLIPQERAGHSNVFTAPLPLDNVELSEKDVTGKTRNSSGFKEMRHEDDDRRFIARSLRPNHLDVWLVGEAPRETWIQQMHFVPPTVVNLRVWMEGEIDAPKSAIITEWGGQADIETELKPFSRHYWVLRIGEARESPVLAKAISRYMARYGVINRERLRPDESPFWGRVEWRWGLRWRLKDGAMVKGQVLDRRTGGVGNSWMRRVLDFEWENGNKDGEPVVHALPLSVDLQLENIMGSRNLRETGRFRVKHILVHVQSDVSGKSKNDIAELMARCKGMLFGTGGMLQYQHVGKITKELGIAPWRMRVVDFSHARFVVTDGKSNVEMTMDDIYPGLEGATSMGWRTTRRPIPMSDQWPDEFVCKSVKADDPNASLGTTIVQRGDHWVEGAKTWVPPEEISLYTERFDRAQKGEGGKQEVLNLTRKQPSIGYFRRAWVTQIFGELVQAPESAPEQVPDRAPDYIVDPEMAAKLTETEQSLALNIVRNIHHAKVTWGISHNQNKGAQPPLEDLRQYLQNIDNLPTPGDGEYIIGRLGEPVRYVQKK